MKDTELDRRSIAEAGRIRAEADRIADTEQAWAAVSSLAEQPAPVRRVEIAPPARRRRPHRRLLAGTAAAAIAVSVAGLVVLRRASDDDQHRISPASPTGVPAETAAPTVAAPTSTSGWAGTVSAGWYVPAWVPDGFRIAGATAIDYDQLVGEGGFDAWADARPGGTARLHWTTHQGTYGPTNTGSGEPRVRGVAAIITEADGITDVQWTDAGRVHSVTSTLEQSATVAIIEAATIDLDGFVTLDPATLPAGFEHVDPARSDPAPSNGLTTSLTFRRDGDAAASLSLSVSPNTAGFSLDRDPGQVGAERRAIGAIERNVRSRERDGGTMATVVTWYLDGYALRLEADNVDPTSVDAFVAGIAAADRSAFLAFEREITSRGLASPALDRATFGDGLTVSLRSTDSEAFTGAENWRREGYVCVDAQPSVCAAPGPSSLFEIDGQKIYIHWTRDDMEGTTILGAASVPEPLDNPSATRSPTVEQLIADGAVALTIEQVRSAHGTFVRIEVPDDVRYVILHRGDGWGGWIVDGTVLDLPIHTAADD